MSHYDEAYFEWQEKIGAFGGKVNISKFSDLLAYKPKHILDVGCGGGFLAEKIETEYIVKVDGFEVNPRAIVSCKEKNIKVSSSFDEIPDHFYDLIISNHCLEHVPSPLDFIKQLKTKLAVGGLLRFYVPLDSRNVKYDSNNIDQHLYSWSPMNLGNLFGAAGFSVIEAKAFNHRWPPFYLFIYKLLGDKGFNIASSLYGHLYTKYNQAFVTCQKLQP